MSFWNEKIKPHLEGHHKLIIAVVLLAVLAGTAYYFRLDIKDKVIKAKPQPIQSMELANTNFALQAINSPKLNVQEIDRVSAFFVKNGHVFFSMRNPDGSETQVEAFDLKDGALVPYRGFGKDGILTIKEKMVFGMTVDSDNNVYYVKKGVHALISGNDIASLQGNTTATRIAFLPGEQQAYLYGNDNFTLADVKDGGLTNNHPSFLHNRANPFKGGLTLVQVMDDGTVYGGGRIKPNGFNIIGAFKPDGKLIQYYGSYQPTDKDSIYNLVDMAIMDHYIAVIDGFTLKLWRRNGMYLGYFNSSKLLGGDLNCLRLSPLDDRTMLILAYVRNAKTKLVDLKVFRMQFPE